MQVKNLHETIEALNKSVYGNAASIFTSGGKNTKEFVSKAKAGNLGINIGVAQPSPLFPFAGMKESFFGILHG